MAQRDDVEVPNLDDADVDAIAVGCVSRDLATLYRQTLHGSLLAGATGWIGWNSTDFDLVAQDPYRHHPFELTFGVTRVDGTPKQTLVEVAAFRDVLDAIDIARCRRPETGTAIVVSSYLEREYPLTEPRDREGLRPILLQAYVAGRGADLGAALTREVDGIGDDRLLVVPCTKQLLGPTWLLSHADDAVTVAPTLPANAVLLDLAADEPVDRVALPSGGVRALRLRSGYHPGAAAAR